MEGYFIKGGGRGIETVVYWGQEAARKRSLVELKCNRALVFMSTRALCPSISPGL